MKRSRHIVVLLITLVWVSFPHLTTEKTRSLDLSCLRQQTDNSPQTILLNLPVKSDTRVDLPSATFLPEFSETEISYHALVQNWPKDYTSSVVSRFLYTQITSSYL